MNSDTESLLTVRDWLRWAVSRFHEAGLTFGHGTDNAVDEARFLVFSCLSLPQDCGDWVLDAHLVDSEKRRLRHWLEKRVRHRLPAPYIAGAAWFAGISFQVDQRVLIPRSPIAELIEASFLPWLEHDSAPRVLDLCCGGGCIGIACAIHFDVDTIDLLDLSEAAVAVAEQNVTRHGLESTCTVLRSDLFDAVPDQRYDLIVSNPPYVDVDDMTELPAEFRHEPRMALEAGQDGLDIVRRILAEAGQHLSHNGVLVVEVGNSAPALQAAYPELPFLWLDFERGGQGVFLLTAEQLSRHSVEPE